MTVDDQLRDIARHADQHQHVITAEEIVQRASHQGHLPVQFTEEDVTIIDLEAPVPTETRQKGRRGVVAAGLLAATVVAIAVVATRDDDATPADQPSPTVTVPPTVPPQPLPNEDGPLVPGTYYADEVSGTRTPRIFATIGAGWEQYDQWSFFKRTPDFDRDEIILDEMQQRDIGFMRISQPAAVFRDACHPGVDHPSYRGPVTTLDGLVVALSEQKGWAEVTAASDISIDGYAGKAFQRTAPADISDCERVESYGPRVRRGSPPYPVFVSWVSDTDDLFSGSGPYEPGEIETLWVLDLDGTLVVINTRTLQEPSAGAPADFAADVLDSIRIERP